VGLEGEQHTRLAEQLVALHAWWRFPDLEGHLPLMLEVYRPQDLSLTTVSQCPDGLIAPPYELGHR
jgi:hypothetical protein